MLKDSADLLFPFLDEYAPVNDREKKIINAVIRMIRNNMDVCQCPDDAPGYISISRKQLADMSQLSETQVCRFLMKKDRSKILVISSQKKFNWKNGYHVNFDEVKRYNELAKPKRIQIEKLEKEIFCSAKAKWDKAKKRSVHLFDYE